MLRALVLSLLAVLLVAAPAGAAKRPTLTTTTAKRAVTEAVERWKPRAVIASVTCRPSGRAKRFCSFRAVYAVTVYTGTASVTRGRRQLKVTFVKRTTKAPPKTPVPARPKTSPAPAVSTAPPTTPYVPAPLPDYTVPPKDLTTRFDAQMLATQVARTRAIWLDGTSVFASCSEGEGSGTFDRVAGRPVRCRYSGRRDAPISYLGHEAGGWVTVTLHGRAAPEVVFEPDPAYGTVADLEATVEAEAAARHPGLFSIDVSCGGSLADDVRGRTVTCSYTGTVYHWGSHWETWSAPVEVVVDAAGATATFTTGTIVHSTGAFAGGGSGSGGGSSSGGTWHPGGYVSPMYVPSSYVSGYGVIPGYYLPGYTYPSWYG